MPATLPEVFPHLAEDWTTLSYAQLVGNLEMLTREGVLKEGSLACALAVARLVDRGRIARSPLSAADLQQALDAYRATRGLPAIERALEQAVEQASACDRDFRPGLRK